MLGCEANVEALLQLKKPIFSLSPVQWKKSCPVPSWGLEEQNQSVFKFVPELQMLNPQYDCDLGMQQTHRKSGAVRLCGAELRNGSISVIMSKLIWDGHHASLAERYRSSENYRKNIGLLVWRM
ncbi:uncharacterized protein LOC131066131 isoform X1 [Cryptomeria japonica]|uniref:uncharacterized protein LOC131066131 isoform X1 n=1 Tax=Cryptomeria japonica TaxID=3369 RepID=UPI0025AD7780|nr:uncharacterized protein LOC131066131 isoform X1 [Cryptomeria japonica]